MKLWLVAFFTLLFVEAKSQQTIVLCDHNKTVFTYSVETSQPGVLQWSIDGEQVASQVLVIDWKDYKIGNHSIFVTFFNGGCEAKQSFEITLKDCPEMIIWIPNSFTPDGDDTNPLFMPVIYNLEPDEYSFEIYNRWGERIFFTQDHKKGWDGSYYKRECPVDIYAYKLYVKKGDKIYNNVGKVSLIK
jgi:gliding motility-associated-like protein